MKRNAPGITNPLLAWSVVTVLLLIRASAAEPAAAASQSSEAKAREEKAGKLLELFESDSSITNSLGMILVHLPGGFRVAQYEVTQGDYQTVTGENPSRFPGARRPVEHVTWNQAKSFCDRLTQKDSDAGLIPPGYRYALPTEAQWDEYVGDARLQDAITSHLGDRRSTENVGGLPPNQYGLYDTRGNVWEWCSSPVARGASWRSHEDFLDIRFRFVGEPDRTYDDIGFRVVLQAPASSR